MGKGAGNVLKTAGGTLFGGVPGGMMVHAQQKAAKEQKRAKRTHLAEVAEAERQTGDAIQREEDTAIGRMKRRRRSLNSGYGGDRGGTIATSTIGVPGG